MLFLSFRGGVEYAGAGLAAGALNAMNMLPRTGPGQFTLYLNLIVEHNHIAGRFGDLMTTHAARFITLG